MQDRKLWAHSASANERHLSSRCGVMLGIVIGSILVILAASGGKHLPGPQSRAGAHTGGLDKSFSETSGQGDGINAVSARSRSTIDHIALLTSQSALTKAPDTDEKMQLGRCGGDYVCHDFQTTMILAEGPQASVGPAQPGRVSLDRECAVKDLQIITLIEHYGDTGEMSHEDLAAAAMTMIDARSICADGQVAQALERYDRLLANKALASTK